MDVRDFHDLGRGRRRDGDGDRVPDDDDGGRRRRAGGSGGSDSSTGNEAGTGSRASNRATTDQGHFFQ